jgi:hypothetical protein
MLILIGIFGGSLLYLYVFSKTYPLPIVSRVSLDAKIKFIREKVDINSIDTVIVGSSIGLNNVQGIVLEQSSKKINKVLNLSSLGLAPIQIEQLLEITTIFPKLKRVIYSAQFADFWYPFVFDEDFDASLIGRYISNNESFKDNLYLLFVGYKNILTFIKNHWLWDKKYVADNTNYCLSFDSSGSVPLRIYGSDIDQKMWSEPDTTDQSEENYQALDRMAKKLSRDDIIFYFVLQPYREPLLRKYTDLNTTMINFGKRVKNLVLKRGGKFLNLHDQLHFSDTYFVDREHLNDKGSAIASRAIAKFIDINER